MYHDGVEEDEFDIGELELPSSRRNNVDASQEQQQGDESEKSMSAIMEDSFRGQWGVRLGNNSPPANNNGSGRSLDKQASTRALLQLEGNMSSSALDSGTDHTMSILMRDSTHDSNTAATTNTNNNINTSEPQAPKMIPQSLRFSNNTISSTLPQQQQPPTTTKTGGGSNNSSGIYYQLGLLIGLSFFWLLFELSGKGENINIPGTGSSSSSSSNHYRVSANDPNYVRAQAIHKLLAQHHVVASTTLVQFSKDFSVVYKNQKQSQTNSKKKTGTTTVSSSSSKSDNNNNQKPPWSNAAQKAFTWIVLYDPAKLDIHHSEIVPRFVLATWYYSMETTTTTTTTNNNNNSHKSKTRQSKPTTPSATRSKKNLNQQKDQQEQQEQQLWMTENSICQWRGILCAADKPHGSDATTQVTHLHWIAPTTTTTSTTGNGNNDDTTAATTPTSTKPQYKSGAGTIPPELGALSHLQSLDIRHNHLHGTIPKFLFSHMLQLRYIRLDHNHLTGSLPRSLATATPQLEELQLSNNALMGTLPSKVLSHCTNLRILTTTHNHHLTGHVPSLDQLTKLGTLVTPAPSGNNKNGN